MQIKHDYHLINPNRAAHDKKWMLPLLLNTLVTFCPPLSWVHSSWAQTVRERPVPLCCRSKRSSWLGGSPGRRCPTPGSEYFGRRSPPRCCRLWATCGRLPSSGWMFTDVWREREREREDKCGITDLMWGNASGVVAVNQIWQVGRNTPMSVRWVF